MPKKHKKISPLALNLCFLLTFGLALADGLSGYIQSSFLTEALGLSWMSIAVALAAAATTITSLSYPKLINSLGNYHSALFTSFITLSATLLLAISNQPWLTLMAFIIRYIGLILISVNLDIFIENNSQDAKTGSIRSRNLTIMNLAWLLSPVLAGYLTQLGGFATVYKVSFWVLCLFSIALIFIAMILGKENRQAVQTGRLSVALKSLFGSRDLKIIFGSSLALQLFYSMAVIYVPIRLNQELGMSWEALGIIFTIMLLPFILFQYPAGLLADKRWGEKEMLIIGNLIIAAACILITFTSSTAIWLWAVILFFSRIGAAISETMQETYFYKQIDAGDIGLITLFRQMRSLGWLLGAGIALIYLNFLPLRFIFLILAFIFIFNLFSLAKLKDTL